MEMDLHKKSPSPLQHRVDTKHVHDSFGHVLLFLESLKTRLI